MATARQKRCRHSIVTAARLIHQRCERHRLRLYPVMVTLTFADTETFRRRCITECMKRIREWLGRQGHDLVGCWKLERGEKKGRIHYHALLWLPYGVTLPKPDKRGWWTHGMTRTERARNAVGYIAKYAGKDTDLAGFKGARMFGILGLEPDERDERMWWLCPRYVREKFAIADRPRRARGGGWVALATGELIRSRWRFGGICTRGGRRFAQLVEI